jgi:hypothetical protein|tara:strand:- start:1743 stop:2486 length:744 start_codon:yes stop_codon:yes gene_type:complete
MKYFDLLPNVYVGEGITDDEAYKYRLAKNIFRRTQTRADLAQYITLMEAFIIPNGERPERLAQAVLGNAYLDWIILLVNNITDVYSQWPKTEEVLREHVNNEYADPDAIHHYETVEAKYNGEVFLKKGLEVNRTWRTVLPDGSTLGEEASVYPVSNYEHEVYLNEQKAIIKIPTTPVVEFIMSEFEELVAYESHAELDEFGDKKTEIGAAARFLDNTGYVTGSVNIDSNVGNVTSYDNGPGSATTTV